MTKRAIFQKIALLALLLGIAFLVSPIPAAEPEQDNGYQNGFFTPEIPETNQSVINETALEKYKNSPEPVTIFKAEVSETSLPGPRYMAFGPSVIGISVSPVILSAIIVLIVLGIAAWCIRTYGRNDHEREE